MSALEVAQWTAGIATGLAMLTVIGLEINLLLVLTRAERAERREKRRERP